MSSSSSSSSSRASSPTFSEPIEVPANDDDNTPSSPLSSPGSSVSDLPFEPPFSKREYLLAQIRQKDAIIESLLKQLHNPYLATPLSIASYRMATSPSDSSNRNVLAWLDRLQSSVQSAGGKAGSRAFKDARGGGGGDHSTIDDDSDHEDDNLTHAQRYGLVSGNPPEGVSKAAGSGDDNSEDGDEKLQSSLPDSHVPLGLIANLSLSNNTKARNAKKEGKEDLLDEADLDDDNVGVANDTYFMPGRIISFYPVCFYPTPDLLRMAGPATDLDIRATLIEQHSPPEILVHGLVTPDDVDRLFEMIATDLNLHQIPATKPHNEKQEREILNRTRVWMMCFNLDRSTATQFGKPSTIKEDYIIRNSAEWFKKSPFNLDASYDVHLCGHTALLRIVARFHEEIFSDPNSPSGLNKRVDFRTVTMDHDARLTQFEEEWTRRFSETLKPGDRGAEFRCSLLPFLVAYSRLVMFSFGFQQAFQRGVQRGDNIFLIKCLESAKAVITCMVDSLAPSGYMRYAPDGHFVFASFASAFLLKLLRPEFSNLLPKEEGSEIYQLIGRLIQTLSSPSIAIDDRHTPKLYARFLAGLLSHHRRDGATVGRLHPQPPPQQQLQPGSLTDYAQSHTSSMTTTFSVSSTNTRDHQSSQPAFSQSTFRSDMSTTPIYRPEATYTAGAGAIQFDVDPNLMNFDGNSVSDGEMLATMQALKNPNWWTNMMMPGFSWPESHSSPSNSSNSPTPPSSHHHHQQPLAHSANYGIFHAAPQQIRGY
uniref:Xylanolytic transcriptional activator regulatory domain-containing protein n=1 Tax=Moniliophthora roreri TaxID=221103 RepID=A0A0W0G6S0_MONRR